MSVSVAPITSICVVTEGHSREFELLSLINSLSDFEANSEWSSLSEGFDYALNDQTILLDRFFPPKDMCSSLVEGIINVTASIVSDGSYEPNSSISKAGTSAVILAPSTTCQPKHWAKGYNWVTSPEESQSTYRSKLAGVIAGLTILYVLVSHHNIIEGSVTIALDGERAMKESAGDWPLSLDQKFFYYLQVIWAWTKLSPLIFTFQYVKGHQTDHVSYSKLDWWGQRNEDVNEWAKAFL